MDSKNLQRGMRGDDVRALQMKLHRLGFDLAADGVYGADTERAVHRLQTLFGHPADGAVGDATWRLIRSQIDAGWNVQLPNAAELAMRSQTALEGTTRPEHATQDMPEFPSSPRSPDAWHTAVPTSRAPGTARPAGAPGRQPSSTLPDRPPRR